MVEYTYEGKALTYGKPHPQNKPMLASELPRPFCDFSAGGPEGFVIWFGRNGLGLIREKHVLLFAHSYFTF